MYEWWEEVEAAAPLMQGDLIEGCPVAVFNDQLAFNENDNLEALLATLRGGVGIETNRAIVMTQACDLEQRKVRNAILCPAYALSEFRGDWEADWEAKRGAAPKEGDWKGHINGIKAGRIWNFTLLRKRTVGEGVQVTTETTVVDFHEVFSLPVHFLELWLSKGGNRRLRLLPPYREHLSQAFARFFMRVGLPVDIDDLLSES